MFETFASILAVLTPFFGSAIAGLFFRNSKPSAAISITVFGMVVSFLSSCFLFYKAAILKVVLHVKLLDFLVIQGFSSSWNVHVDALTAVMFLVVTSVSLLVHIYSIGYMHDDECQPKFMAFLSLFTFFMLVLVSAADFIQLFVGWEGVGLCSYLLIGFWYKKESATDAGIKAFITNRVGDMALILGLCGIYAVFGTFEFEPIFHDISAAQVAISVFGWETDYITLICLLLFIGCMGKSAQLFLHVWLPDAMEGPTPVSALIHAATMVTAGVFLVARASFLFEYSLFVRDFIVVVGMLTSLFAATIALTQRDIKKIIAYSTCSQLGYMFVAAGLSAYSAGVFHLATHAFFKALLFLGAGSVIHAMSGEQDIFKMGALRKKIPLTFACILIGSIAIAGIPPLSGFFSKDAILEAGFMSGSMLGKWAFGIGTFVAFLTTFYSWRLLILVFNGAKTNSSDEVVAHIHESPKVITMPLIALSVLAIGAGLILEYVFHILSSTAGIFADSIGVLKENDVLARIHDTPLFAKLLPTVLSVLAIALAYFVFLFGKLALPAALKPIYTLFYNKYYIDEIYSVIFVKPTKVVSSFFVNFFDKKVIDAIFVGGFMAIVRFVSLINSRLQSGKIKGYIFLIFIVVALIFEFVIVKSKINIF